MPAKIRTIEYKIKNLEVQSDGFKYHYIVSEDEDFFRIHYYELTEESDGYDYHFKDGLTLPKDDAKLIAETLLTLIRNGSFEERGV